MTSARRWTAIIRPFIDIGVSVSEAAGIMLPDDLDLDDQVVVVLGKGRRQRAVPFGRKTALALDRYLRLRAAGGSLAQVAGPMTPCPGPGPYRFGGVTEVPQSEPLACGEGVGRCCRPRWSGS
jgi:integrase